LMVAGVLVTLVSGMLVFFRIFILGGQPAPNRPWIVQVDSGGSGCTGTIVGRRAVLTAAHCFTEPEVANVPIQIEGQGTVKAVCRRHNEYETLPISDVAICFLNDDSTVRPRLVARTATPFNKRPVVFFGFGCVSLNPPVGFGVRRKGKGKATVLASGVFEIAGNGVCDGDSGGPVFVDDGHEDDGLVVAVISDEGYGSDSIAWSLTQANTASWLDRFKGSICFEGDSGGVCDPAARDHTELQPHPGVERQAASRPQTEVLR
jgi:hypothetical protein